MDQNEKGMADKEFIWKHCEWKGQLIYIMNAY